MSSFRNAVKRKTHKERAQPAERRKLGLLEKHKDYVLRAKDYHRKEAVIRNLREKAAMRNPDEFYFKMENTRTIEGVHDARPEEKKYTPEELRLMKTQDAAYVLNKAQAEARKVERLRAALHSIGEAPANKRIVFVEDREEAAEAVHPEEGQPAAATPLPEKIQRRRASAYRELEERNARAQKMKMMAMKMAFEKQIMGKGRKRKLRPEERADPNGPKVYKWKRERLK